MRIYSTQHSANSTPPGGGVGQLENMNPEALTQLVKDAIRQEVEPVTAVLRDIQAALMATAPAVAVNDDGLLDVRRAALRLGLSASTVYKLAQRCELTSVLLGRRRLFKPADLDAYAHERRSSPERVQALAAGARGP